jgi:hypothetical protein
MAVTVVVMAVTVATAVVTAVMVATAVVMVVMVATAVVMAVMVATAVVMAVMVATVVVMGDMAVTVVMAVMAVMVAMAAIVGDPQIAQLRSKSEKCVGTIRRNSFLESCAWEVGPVVKTKFAVSMMYLSIVQLLLVILGVCYVELERIPLVGVALHYFSFASGASNSYGFFAPDVAGQLRVLFDVTHEDGEKITIPLGLTSSHEADLRLGNIVDQYFRDDEDPESLQRGLASSFATNVFGRDPRTKSVEVRFEELIPVSLMDYKEGHHPEWRPLYKAKFEVDNIGDNEVEKIDGTFL